MILQMIVHPTVVAITVVNILQFHLVYCVIKPFRTKVGLTQSKSILPHPLLVETIKSLDPVSVPELPILPCRHPRIISLRNPSNALFVGHHNKVS